MRARRLRNSALIVLAAGLGTLAVLGAFSSNGPERGAPLSPADASQVFTPAHLTALDAVREFFGRHPVPVQPIAYTHKVHLANGMQCVNCHTGVDTGPDAQLPSIKLCMMCHQAIATDKPEIKKLAAYYERGEDVSWQRVYDYPPSSHVKFNHAPHIRAGVDCKVCHGDMTQATVAVRVVNMNMGFCLDCHKQKNASIDCTTCHF
ncbi:MAG TPA: cytochrome c3 family protein [Terriglobia bacterium]|nr:cytochrome c3 family protein [Terriglobia bacterium]